MPGQEKVEINDRGDNPGGREQRDLAGELKSLEAQLATLSPRPDRLDRDRLMFLAGQASLVQVSADRSTMLGAKPVSRAWPTAFAAMTALAATLLAMLIARPEQRGNPSSPTNRVRQNDPRIARGHRSNEITLSPLDAHIGDIDRWLTRDEGRSDVPDPSMEHIQTSRIPILTPARWEQVLTDPEPLDASPSGASNFRQIQGARS